MDCSPELITDQDLITACLLGDRRAFGELVCRYRDGVVNVIYRMCGDGDLAEESAQEAFIRAWQKLASYNPQYPFRAWLYRIAINLTLDFLRREPKTIDVDAPAVENRLVSGVMEGPEAALVHKERVERIRRAVLGLPEASRAVLILREYEGMAYQEIAAALDIPVGTVMSRLNYARGQLRRLLIDEAMTEREVV